MTHRRQRQRMSKHERGSSHKRRRFAKGVRGQLQPEMQTHVENGSSDLFASSHRCRYCRCRFRKRNQRSSARAMRVAAGRRHEQKPPLQSQPSPIAAKTQTYVPYVQRRNWRAKTQLDLTCSLRFPYLVFTRSLPFLHLFLTFSPPFPYLVLTCSLPFP